MNDPHFSAYFRPGDHRILKSRGHAFPPLQPVLRGWRPVQSYVLPSVPALGAFRSQGPLPSLCYSGLGGAGRSRGPAGSGGEGRRERVCDTRGGRRRRGCRTPPWEESGQVWLGAGCQLGGDLRPTDQHQHPAATQVLCVLAALRATTLPPTPAPRPSPSPDLRPPRRAAPAAAWTAPVERSVLATLLHFPLQFPGFGLSFGALRLFRAGRPRLCLRTERLFECPPT